MAKHIHIHCRLLDQEVKEKTEKYYSEFLKRKGIVDMKRQGWDVKSEQKNPEGSFVVSFIKRK